MRIHNDRVSFTSPFFTMQAKKKLNSPIEMALPTLAMVASWFHESTANGGGLKRFTSPPGVPGCEDTRRL